jgi:hypothetical protein
MSGPLDAIGKLFGGSTQQQVNPLLMVPQMPATPPTIQSPTGSQTSSRPQTNTSFVSASAPVPNQQNTATKSLLGA